MSDALNRLLADLPMAEPDPSRAARVHASCRAKLARRAARPAPPTVRRPPVWPRLVAVLGVAYLIAAVAEAVAMMGVRAQF